MTPLAEQKLLGKRPLHRCIGVHTRSDVSRRLLRIVKFRKVEYIRLGAILGDPNKDETALHGAPSVYKRQHFSEPCLGDEPSARCHLYLWQVSVCQPLVTRYTCPTGCFTQFDEWAECQPEVQTPRLGSCPTEQVTT